MKTCEVCGGLRATEEGEMIAGTPCFCGRETKTLCERYTNGVCKELADLRRQIDRHHELAAHVRALLHNVGFGPNTSQLKRADNILMEIAGLPTTPDVTGQC
jgi:hypothetical protein